jgi:secreted trypsin-like serine protease
LEDKIYNGNITSLGEHPWAVPIFYKLSELIEPKFGGMGTIIHSKYILTSAHCVVPVRKIDHVRLGEWDLARDPDYILNNVDGTVQINPEFETVKVVKTHVHPKYNLKSKLNDIALLKLDKSLNFSKKPYKPVCLSSKNTFSDKIEDLKIKEGDIMLAIGWGSTEASQKSDILMKGYLKVKNMTKCEEVYGNVRELKKETQICAGDDIVDTW